MLYVSKFGPTQKTHLMYKSNLSFDQLQKYIKLLTEKGLLEEMNHSERKSYHTTEKGILFVQEFQKLEALQSVPIFNEIGEELSLNTKE